MRAFDQGTTIVTMGTEAVESKTEGARSSKCFLSELVFFAWCHPFSPPDNLKFQPVCFLVVAN